MTKEDGIYKIAYILQYANLTYRRKIKLLETFERRELQSQDTVSVTDQRSCSTTRLIQIYEHLEKPGAPKDSKLCLAYSS